MRSTCIAICIFISAVSLSAQETGIVTRPRFGLFGNLNYNMHQADFRSLPNVPCCSPLFTDGSGLDFSAGLLYEFPLVGHLSLALRGGYWGYSGEFSTDEPKTVNLNGEAASGLFRHTLDTRPGVLGLEPLLGYNLFDRFSLHAGPQIGFLLRKSYEQSEALIEPSVGTFENGKRSRLESSGTIADVAPLFAGITMGMSYEILLNKKATWILAPEAFFTLGLTDVLKDSAWKVNSIRVGVALKYAPLTQDQPHRDASDNGKPLLVANVVAFGLESDGQEQPDVRLHVEEFGSTQMHPLLNAVFFAENSDAIPGRYTNIAPSQTDAFRLDQFHDANALDIYHQVLNIVGRRMRDNPDANLTLMGCNADAGGEKGNTALSRRRAEHVRDYLQTMWNIDPSRIRIDARGLPQTPSNPAEKEGVEENRRVEMSSNDSRIFEPLITNGVTRIADPPSIRFKLAAEAEKGIRDWHLTASQDGHTLREFSGTGALPTVIDWPLNDTKSEIPKAPSKVDYQLTVTDTDGQTYSSETGDINVEQVTLQKKRNEHLADKSVDRYSLIGFDFEKSDLNDLNKQAIAAIKKRIPPGATVQITGHTDHLGDSKFNQELSEKRARLVANELNAPNTTVQGVGENQLLFTTNIPEGRFYNRMVDVTVETPVP